ncbi:cytochrome c oxidase assembly protein [Naasia lichenicola]|uniref:Copper transporter n=1 Tax=Naasia lichenicola TaxID=2565933 RepID=A0A4S4FLG2_9MICO|nr:cytochrome c oxidase assembly protein [Naasia lichenicola]THG31031.1 copper transporter [Naasia lichenicola]
MSIRRAPTSSSERSPTLGSPLTDPPRGWSLSRLKRRDRLFVFGTILLALVIAIIAALLAAAASSAENSGLPFLPPLYVQLGLPIIKALTNLASASTIGALLMAAIAVPRRSPAFQRLLDVAALSAASWAGTGALAAVLTFLSIAGDFRADVFIPALVQFLLTISLGRAWLITVVVASILAVVCFVTRRQGLVAILTVISLAALAPLALEGHAAGSSGHSAASSSMWLHMAGASVWVGGLIALVAVRRAATPEQFDQILQRFSAIAGAAFVFVAFSGLVSATYRLARPEDFASVYGAIVIIKAVCLILLGALGWAQRRRLTRLIRSAPPGRSARLLAALILFELVLMGIASGLAAALAGTSPPEGDESPARTATERVTGERLPEPFTFDSVFNAWSIDPVWALIAAFAGGLYLAGVRRLRRRGDRWPIGRTISFLLGLLVLAYVTNGVANAYGAFLFSVHMLSHMTLSMAIPVLLVLGSPITLALRTLQKRQDDSNGPREWLLYLLHSRVTRFATNPLVTAVAFAGSLVVFYYTPLFRWALSDPIGHQWMTAHFLIVGYLFALSMVDGDPISFRFPYPVRLLILMATMGFHGFFGTSLMGATQVLLPDWYGVVAADWGIDALQDQFLAGGIAWGLGEVPTLALALIVALQWNRSDERESRRVDRSADRTDDAELRSYNQMLNRLKGRP